MLPCVSSYVHGDMLVVSHCGETSQASPPAAPGSLNQAGLAWLGLIRGQSRQHEGSLSGGATGGNVETGKKKHMKGREK